MVAERGGSNPSGLILSRGVDPHQLAGLAQEVESRFSQVARRHEKQSIDISDLEFQYLSSLKDYLAEPKEEALSKAFEFGRKALNSGFALLDMAALHHGVVLGIIKEAATVEECAQNIKLAEVFFIESLGPYEMTHRGYYDAKSVPRLTEKLEDEARKITHALRHEVGQLVTSINTALEGISSEVHPPARERGEASETQQAFPIHPNVHVKADAAIADPTTDRPEATESPNPSLHRARIRILLADDHVMFRQALKSLIEKEGFEVVGEASDGYEAVQMARSTRPDLALLDVGMPLLNSIDSAREIMKASPKTKTILLTTYTEDECVMVALRAGIKGYVLKTQTSSDLAQAIREVFKGAVYLSSGISQTVVKACLARDDLPADPLTPRERQVLQLIAEGKTSKEIATVLGISPRTADSHRTRLMQKLGIHDTAGVVRYAIRQRLINA